MRRRAVVFIVAKHKLSPALIAGTSALTAPRREPGPARLGDVLTPAWRPPPWLASGSSVGREASALCLIPRSIRLAIGGSPNSMNSVQNRFAGRARIRKISRVLPPGSGVSSQDHVLSGFSQSSHWPVSKAFTLNALNSFTASSMPNMEFMLNAQSPTARCWYSSRRWSALG